MTPVETSAGDLLVQLEQVIAERLRQRPAGSYVAELLEGGHPVQAGKVIEEAYELIAACAEDDRPAIIHEAADVVFHLLVLLQANGAGWPDVVSELSRRFGLGGLAEKASRTAVGTRADGGS